MSGWRDEADGMLANMRRDAKIIPGGDKIFGPYLSKLEELIRMEAEPTVGWQVQHWYSELNQWGPWVACDKEVFLICKLPTTKTMRARQLYAGELTPARHG